MQSQTLKSVPKEALNQRNTLPRNKTTLIPTISVKLKDSEHKQAIVINESDFNENLHTRVTPEDAHEEQMEELGKPEMNDPVAEYKVFMEFKFQGLLFEKNGTVKLRKSVAKVISERFHCIWPTSMLGKVDEDTVLRDSLVRGVGGELEIIDPADKAKGA